MPEVTYIESDGTEHLVDVPCGNSLMEGATANGIDGIVAECGGACSCATCHCYVDEAWYDKLFPPGETEKDLLECVGEPGPTSRLSCQISMREALEGITVRLPASQY
ncbi:MAG: 2Fe-2S iron-sulfur cluster-binding protein [Pseudomonadota bacterium]|nr:2Fe-2S iron-sulfur cluster-binding protein [Pseudomonadota bacterium]